MPPFAPFGASLAASGPLKALSSYYLNTTTVPLFVANVLSFGVFYIGYGREAESKQQNVTSRNSRGEFDALHAIRTDGSRSLQGMLRDLAVWRSLQPPYHLFRRDIEE
jgi:hypothetical protein